MRPAIRRAHILLGIKSRKFYILRSINLQIKRHDPLQDIESPRIYILQGVHESSEFTRVALVGIVTAVEMKDAGALFLRLSCRKRRSG